MSRYLFAPEPIINILAGSAAVQIGANAPFTLWTARTGGTQVTDCVAPDGLSALPMSGGAFVADASGQPPAFYGPDGVVELWLDAGAGVRYQLVGSDLVAAVLRAAIDWLAGNFPNSGTGGGLPADVTLEEIPNGVSRVAMTLAERQQLAKVPTSFLKVGTAATDAKPGNYAPTAEDVKAVRNVGGFGRVWGNRTSTQGPPSAAEGAQDGDYCVIDAVS